MKTVAIVKSSIIVIDTYSFNFYRQIFKFSLETMVCLVETGGLGQRCLELRLSFLELGVQLSLQLIEFLRPDSALTTLTLGLPHVGLIVGLLQETLEISSSTLFLLELFAGLV